MLDTMAAPYESGTFAREEGGVRIGSHLDDVGKKRMTVIFPTEDTAGMERIARSWGC